MVNHTPVVPGLRGLAEVEAIHAGFHAGFPDLDGEIVGMLADGDRIVEHWAVADQLGLLSQLGAMPSAPATRPVPPTA